MRAQSTSRWRTRRRLAVAAGPESSDPVIARARDERAGHCHEDLVSVRKACPSRFSAGIGQPDLSLLPARLAVDAADLAAGRGSAMGLHHDRGLLEQGEPGRGLVIGGRWLGRRSFFLAEQHRVAIGVKHLLDDALSTISPGGDGYAPRFSLSMP
jgi:hypothetical protein